MGHEDVKTTISYITFDTTRIQAINDLQYLNMHDSFDVEELRAQNKTLKNQLARALAENKQLKDLLYGKQMP